MYCSTCGDDRRFERPPCADGHGEDCPELACTDCGTAVLMASALPWPAGSASAPLARRSPGSVSSEPSGASAEKPAPVPIRAA